MSTTTQNSADLKIGVVRSAAEFLSIRDQWNVLVNDSASGFVTLTWEWMFTWWEVFGRAGELQILLARNGEELVGIAPLQISTVTELSIPLRRLQLLASGEPEADETCSDYLDFIAARGWETAVTKSFLSHLSQMTDWDELVLTSVPAESLTPTALREAAQSQGLQYSAAERARCVIASLPEQWDVFFSGLSSKLRAQVRRHGRLLAQKGDVVFRRAASQSDLNGIFPEFIKLHQRWWTARGKPGCFASTRFTQFHMRLAARLLAKDRVNLYLLTLGQQPLAARLSFNFRGHVFEYQTGVDPEFDDGRIGLGVLCTARCIEDAVQRHQTIYDFGEGLQPYKLNWGEPKRITLTIRVTQRSVKEFARQQLQTIVETLKKARGVFGGRPAYDTGSKAESNHEPQSNS